MDKQKHIKRIDSIHFDATEMIHELIKIKNELRGMNPTFDILIIQIDSKIEKLVKSLLTNLDNHDYVLYLV